jgi:uncharacterized membrane protein (GlpM family)
MDVKMLPVYFVIGGVVVAASTYFGSQAKSLVAALISLLPTATVVTLCSIYFAAGMGPAVSYAKSMLILLPPWIAYALAVIFLLPRIGLAGSLIVSIAAYLGIAFLIIRLT